MRTLTIPHTDLTVSALCFGAGGLGTRVSPEDSFQLLDDYVALEGNFLDTAHVYAAWVPNGGGVSERTIGEWLRARGNRSDIVIGTKGGHPNLATMEISRLSPAEILQDLHESLERLQIQTIDLYWLHRDDPQIPVGEMIDTLTEAVNAGKIRYFGCSNWTPARMQQALDYARAHQTTGFVANQVGWSLALRNAPPSDTTSHFMDSATHAFHRANDLMVAAYSPQAGGFFSGPYGRDILPPTPGVRKGVVDTFYSPQNFGRLDRVRELASQLHCSPNDIALAYLTSQPFPTVAIVGCGTREHLHASCAGRDLTLSVDEISYIEGGTIEGQDLQDFNAIRQD